MAHDFERMRMQPHHFAALRFLDKKGPARGSDIAMAIRPLPGGPVSMFQYPALGRVICAALARAGYIDRCPDSILWRLTERGRAMVDPLQMGDSERMVDGSNPAGL